MLDPDAGFYDSDPPTFEEEKAEAAARAKVVRPLACPYLRDPQRAVLLRPRDEDDCLRALQELNRSPLPTACVLYELPKETFTSLAPEACPDWVDLGTWIRRHKGLLPEATFFCPAGPQGCNFPCGERAVCRENIDPRALQLARELFADAGAQLLAVADRIAPHFPDLTPLQRQVLTEWALYSEPDAPNRALTQKTLATRYNISERTILNWLDKARNSNSATFAAMEAHRNTRLTPNRAYEVRNT